MNSHLIIVQIVNYNGLLNKNDIFKKCLDSVKDQTYRNLIVHIIDNNSNDGSIDFINQNYPAYKLTVNRKNEGYVAHNRGLKYFYKYNGDYLIVMNNDIILEEDTIEKMVEYVEKNPNIGICSPIINFSGKRDIINSTGILLNYAGFTANRDYLNHYNNKLMNENISALSGAFMIIRKDAVKKTALFDTFYSSYYEDVDLCLRLITETDYSLAINPNCICYHQYSSSWKRKRKKKNFLILRNQYYLINKLFSPDLLFFSIIYLFRTRFLKRNILHLRIMINLFLNLPLLMFNRLIHSIRSKKKVKKFLYPSYKPFKPESPMDEKIELYNEFPDKENIPSRIIMGINDKIIGHGFSLLDNEYPLGRYIIKRATLFLNGKGKLIRIHGFGTGKIEINGFSFKVHGFFTHYIKTVEDNYHTIKMETDNKIKIVSLECMNEEI